ncbi:MAG: 3-deoxy-D-manno-octulosonic acid transferase [Marinilabiliales bacterium]|nr:MAG: 3-deoxy-D-manno-octulosonic acid transferase [Marinilabiliales bacterium]
MRFFYSCSVHFYVFLIRLAALFGKSKAKLWLKGRKLQKSEWTGAPAEDKWIWMHVSSLGEFEQGRTLLEHISAKNEYKILLTFFSPSGFEIRKNYDKADKILYLPKDTGANARKLLEKFHPEMVFFVKYEFWFNYLKVIKKASVPLYLISGIFREKQHFFKIWGGWFRKQLKAFNHFYIQDENSAALLKKAGYTNATVCGDTRFDRVKSIAESAQIPEWLERFGKGYKVYVGGSTWEPDDEYILKLIPKEPETKFIFVPHDVHESRIKGLLSNCPEGTVLYSQKDEHEPEKVKVLIIDSIGLLASLYKMADLAQIGNGFGTGIHNVAEAAVYGCPVIFGPKYQKFKEAVDLIELGGGFSFKNETEYFTLCDKLLHNEKSLAEAGGIAGKYISENSGATKRITDDLGL